MISLIIEQFDKGQTKFSGNQTKTLVPTTSLPDAIYIPTRLVLQSSLNETSNNSNNITARDELVPFYLNAVKFLSSYFQKFCSNIDSISKIMSISSSVFFNNLNSNGVHNQNTLLHANFDLVTLANCFDARRIQPIPIIETSLLKTLQTTSNFFMKPKTGYCALYKNENIILLMDSEPKASKVPLMGM